MKKVAVSKPSLALACALFVLSGCAVTTEPMSPTERLERIEQDQQAMFVDQEPVTGELSLAEAIGRGLKYNLEARVRRMETALALGQTELSSYDMLPQLAASAGYTRRSNVLASRSEIVDASSVPSFASTSQDREQTTAEVELVWNLLDFGVSFYTAKQDADRRLIAEQRREKVVNKLIQDIRSSYWRVAAAQQVEKQLEIVLQDARDSLDDARRIETERLRSPIQSLRVQRSLLSLIEQLETLESELKVARTQLSELAGLKPGTEYRVDESVVLAFQPVRFEADIEKLERTALMNRPEILEESYNHRIAQRESRKALLRMLPGLEFFASYNYSSNSYLLNNEWGEVGAMVNWNLFNLFSGPAAMDLAEQRELLAERRRQALSMAVLAQVNLAMHQYGTELGKYERAQEMARIDGRINEVTAIGVENSAGSRMDQVNAETTALMSELKRLRAAAAVQDAYGKVMTAIGVSLAPEAIEDNSLQSVTQAVSARLETLERGPEAVVDAI